MVKTVLFAMIFASGLVLPARAQAPYNSGITPTEINNFNTYLNNHPKTAQELAANPQLVKDPSFYSTHPGLESFLANHPGVREELNHNPGRFMRTEEGGLSMASRWPGSGRFGVWMAWLRSGADGRPGSGDGCELQKRLP